MGRLGRRSSIAPLTIVVAFVALVVTLAFAWASRTARDENEDRLTQQSAREAIAVLTAGVPAIQAPLETSAGIARVVGSGDAGQFRRVIPPFHLRALLPGTGRWTSCSTACSRT